jgi:hypothetical protein
MGCTATVKPVVIGMNVPASGLALNSTHVFWTGSAGMTWQTDKVGANKVMLGPGGAHVVADEQNVYWTGPTAIYKCAVGGCASPTVLASASGARGIALDATNVYWAEYGAAFPDQIPGSIKRIAK